MAGIIFSTHSLLDRIMLLGSMIERCGYRLRIWAMNRRAIRSLDRFLER